MKRTIYYIIFFSLVSMWLSVGKASGVENPLPVTVSILPQKYFLEKIGGDRVAVSVMVLPGSFPGTYEPKPQQMVSLTESRMYFSIGVPFEKTWLPRFASANSGMVIVHTDKGIEKHSLVESHDHGEAGKNEKKLPDTADRFPDPHIWLAPRLVKVQAQNIRDGLEKIDPEHTDIYESNYTKFLEEIDMVDKRIQSILGGKDSGISFMVFHPSWGYFADEYGLKQIPVEVEGKEPGPRDLARFIRIAKERSIKAVFVQPQVSSKSAETIARAIGGRVVVADPLAEDWAANLISIAGKITEN